MRKTSKWAAPVQTEAARKINAIQHITMPAKCSSNLATMTMSAAAGEGRTLS